MKHQQTGIVLLSTLFIIGVLALLILSISKEALLYLKTSHQIRHKHHTFQQMELVVNELNLTNSACHVRDKDANQLIDLLSANQGCRFRAGAQEYTYIIGDLDVFPCMHLAGSLGASGSHHWVITLFSSDNPHVFLQIRLVSPMTLASCKSGLMHQINTNVISWRRIYVSS